MNDGWIYTDCINKASAGQTVLQYYTKNYCHSTKIQWRERIQSRQILLEDKSTTADTFLQAGQTLTYYRPPWKEPEVPLSFEVIYEDMDLLIVNKPSGLPVLPGGSFLQHTLLYRLQKRYPNGTPIPIHRLGRGTSGLMLLARSKIARSRLSQQMRDRQIEKVYLAKASGIIERDSFSIRDRIGKIPHPVLGYIYGATSSGKDAYSKCRVIRHDHNYTIVEVTILTGRPHQIRIHLAAVGHPLVGDPLYDVGGIPKISRHSGKLITPGDCGYELHAYKLGFKHPVSNRQLNFHVNR